jgi:hypothetical protein
MDLVDQFVAAMAAEGFATEDFERGAQLDAARAFARAFGQHRNGVLASEFRGGTYLESGDAWFWFDGATVRQAFARLFEATAGTE